MTRSLRLAAGIAALAAASVVALSVGGGATGEVPAVTGVVSCSGTSCQATLINNYAAGESPIQGFYLKANKGVSNIAVTSAQSDGANCTAFQGPGGEPECFLKKGHYWESGTSLTLTFSRVLSRSSGGADFTDFAVGVVITLNQVSYVTSLFQLVVSFAGDPCFRLYFEELAEIAELKEELGAAEAAWDKAEANLKDALAALKGAPPGQAAALITAIHAYGLALALIDSWGSEVAGILADEEDEFVAIALGGQCIDEGGIGSLVGFKLVGAASAKGVCDDQVKALGTAQGKASVLAASVARYTKSKLGPSSARLRTAVASASKALKSPKTKAAAKAKLRKALPLIAKAQAIAAPTARRLATLPGQAKAAADDVPKAQAALDTCKAS